MPIKKRPTHHRPDPLERIADAFQSIARSVEHIARHIHGDADTIRFTQAELDELYRTASSDVTANNELQEKLREAMKKAGTALSA